MRWQKATTLMTTSQLVSGKCNGGVCERPIGKPERQTIEYVLAGLAEDPNDAFDVFVQIGSDFLRLLNRGAWSEFKVNIPSQYICVPAARLFD